jgi:hypothetical protein
MNINRWREEEIWRGGDWERGRSLDKTKDKSKKIKVSSKKSVKLRVLRG